MLYKGPWQQRRSVHAAGERFSSIFTANMKSYFQNTPSKLHFNRTFACFLQFYSKYEIRCFQELPDATRCFQRPRCLSDTASGAFWVPPGCFLGTTCQNSDFEFNFGDTFAPYVTKNVEIQILNSATWTHSHQNMVI